MSLQILLLVLIAALLHALWNLLAKKTNGKAPFIWLQYVASSLFYLPVILFQSNQFDTLHMQPLLCLSLSSALLHIGYFIILQKGYRSADLSIVYPIARGSGPLFSSIAAIIFLDEAIKAGSVIGLFLIISGVLLITGFSFSKEKNAQVINGVSYGILTGVFIALYTLNDTIGVKTYSLSPLTLTLITNLFSSLLLFPFVVLQKTELRRELQEHKWHIIAVGILSPAAYILVLIALKHAPLIVVAPARETSILLGVFIGKKAFDEKDSKKRLIASVLILGGIVALSLY